MDPRAQAARPEKVETGKYLAFWLGSDEFAVPVRRVREIIPWQEVTAVPRAAAHVLGVINLRGKIVPVMDLRRRLGMAAGERNGRACIVVFQAGEAGRGGPVGAAVDAVSEVLAIPGGEIEETAALGGAGQLSEYVRQIAKAKGRLQLLLAIDAVLADGAGVGKAG